jgi:hypothetical protein
MEAGPEVRVGRMRKKGRRETENNLLIARAGRRRPATGTDLWLPRQALIWRSRGAAHS